MRRNILRIIAGLLASAAIMALLFYFFLFANPLGIYQVNQLKWVPILIVTASVFVSGYINRTTPPRWLFILLLPLSFLKPFNYFYFPFIVMVLGVAVLMLLAPRKVFRYNSIAWGGAAGVFLFFLFSQPLIIENQGFGFDDKGELVNATTLWDFSSGVAEQMPSLRLQKSDGEDFNLSSLQGKTYFITFWATWCAPCMAERPQLEKLKQTYAEYSSVVFIDISFDNNSEIWQAYLSEYQPQGMQLFGEDNQRISRKLGFEGLPMHIIVDEKGHFKKYQSFRVASSMLVDQQ